MVGLAARSYPTDEADQGMNEKRRNMAAREGLMERERKEREKGEEAVPYRVG